MRRRDLILLSLFSGTVATVAPVARAQQSERMRRVGVLLLFAAHDPEAQARVRVFGQELNDLGWVEGRNVQIQYRFAGGDFNRMRTLAEELIERQCDVIVTNALSPIFPVWQQHRATAIVFAMVPNPVDQGLIKSLSHPNESITGFATFEYPAIMGKWLELLKAIAPNVRRVAIMFNPDAYYSYFPPPPGSYWQHHLEAVAPAFAVEPIAIPVHNVTGIESTLGALAREPQSGLLLAVDTFTVGNYKDIVSLAVRHRMPACYPYRYFATEGGLMSYGPNGAQVFRQAASYVDRILKGAKPADLPIQRPTTFELVINLKTAKALGLTVPVRMLARADEIIE